MKRVRYTKYNGDLASEIEMDDLEGPPFSQKGGPFGAYRVFGDALENFVQSYKPDAASREEVGTVTLAGDGIAARLAELVLGDQHVAREGHRHAAQ